MGDVYNHPKGAPPKKTAHPSVVCCLLAFTGGIIIVGYGFRNHPHYVFFNQLAPLPEGIRATWGELVQKQLLRGSLRKGVSFYGRSSWPKMGFALLKAKSSKTNQQDYPERKNSRTSTNITTCSKDLLTLGCEIIRDPTAASNSVLVVVRFRKAWHGYSERFHGRLQALENNVHKVTGFSH